MFAIESLKPLPRNGSEYMTVTLMHICSRELRNVVRAVCRKVHEMKLPMQTPSRVIHARDAMLSTPPREIVMSPITVIIF